MKPTLATGLTVISLLAAASLCLELRHQADLRRAAERQGLRQDSPQPTPGTAESGRQRSGPAGGEKDPRRDARERLRQLLSTGTALDRARGLSQMMATLKSGEFALLLDDLTTLGFQHGTLSRTVLAAWAELDPVAALAWTASEPAAKRIWQGGGVPDVADSAADRGEPIVLKTWLENDATAAIAWAVSQDTDKDSHALLLWTLGEWTRQNAPAALTWVEGQPPGSPGRTEQLARVLGTLITTDLPRVIEAMTRVPAEERAALITGIGTRAAKLPAAERDRWLASIDDSELRETAVAQILGARNGTSIDERLDLLDKYPKAASKPGAAQIYRDWILKDPDAALASLHELEPGELRNEAVQVAAESFSWGSRTSPTKVLELMERYPEAVNEMTLESFFSSAVHNSHEWELGLAQIPRVQNDRAQEMYYREVLQSWLWIDRDAAHKWINSHELPEAVKKEMAAK